MADAETSKKVFLTLGRDDQIGTLFDLFQSVSNIQSKNSKERLEMKAEITYLKGELAGIGRRRDKTMTTSQKIDAALDKREKILQWILDRIIAPTISGVLTLITLAILYLTFGGKTP